MSSLKRINAPKSWTLTRRKGIKFIARPIPGPYKLRESITINIILKELLKYVQTTREVKKVLNDKNILINNIPGKDYRFPVGLFDTLSIPSTKEEYLLLQNTKGKFYLHKLNPKYSKLKYNKIKGKTILKKGKTQINFHNGNNLIITKDSYKTGDTLIIENKTIKKHLKLEKKAFVYLTSGKHKGFSGNIESIEKLPRRRENKIVINSNGNKIITNQSYAFVIEQDLLK